jgi:guanosine-3',5'-bis(diphosphate) 3'-pyrophosphohydrolase
VVEGEDQFRWLRQLIDSQNEISDPREFITSLKVDLYPDEVYCFTPMGEVITLPREATPIDFAYAIHTQVGHRCVGAKVNSRIVPLRHKLKNGEIVEILTAKDAEPNRDWLSFVKTSRARNRIKHFVNQREREDAAELGRKLLEKQARRFKANWKKVLAMPEFSRVIAEHGIQRAEDLYPAVGFGKIAPRQILAALFPEQAPPLETQAKRSTLATVVGKVLGRGDTPIAVRGQGGLLVYRAKCCNPIRGDEIVGYITRGKGISVHTTTCPNLINFLGSDRMTDVAWIDVPGEEIFTVRVAMTIEDRQGILAEITAAVSNLKTNIRESRSTTGEGGQGTVDLTVEINDVRHLQKIIKVLKSIRGINDVTRVSTIP